MGASKPIVRCLVLGSAMCLRDDIKAALRLAEFDRVVAVKSAGLEWGGDVDIWVTLHPEGTRNSASIVVQKEQRAQKGYPPAGRIVSHVTQPMKPGVDAMIDYRFPGQTYSGSSGLLGVKAALELLGADKVVLCGVPLTRDQKRIDLPKPWLGASAFQQGFAQAVPHIREKVRSMSGFTRSLLGPPTPDWLNSSR